MAKKGGKFVILAAVGAACAGAYYMYKKKNETIPENMEDLDLDDGPTADIDKVATDASEVSEEASEKAEGKRTYTSLSFYDVEKKAKDIGEKVASGAEKAAGVLSEKFQSAATRVEEFFDDKKNAVEDAEVSDVAEEAAEAAEAAEEAVTEEKPEE